MIAKTVFPCGKSEILQLVLGKITVVKTILLSKLTHLFISLQSPSKMFIKVLETMFYNYIWGSKTDRVSRNELAKD